MSQLSISPDFRVLTVDEPNNKVIYYDKNQTLEFFFGDEYILSAIENYTHDGISVTNDYTIEANAEIAKTTVNGDDYTLAENKTVEIMVDTGDPSIHFDGQKKFKVGYDTLLIKPTCGKRPIG